MLAEFVINIRYALMSVSLTQKLDDSFTTLPRLICSFSMTDELDAVAASSRGCIGKTYFYGLMLLPVPAWALGTWLGAGGGRDSAPRAERRHGRGAVRHVSGDHPAAVHKEPRHRAVRGRRGASELRDHMDPVFLVHHARLLGGAVRAAGRGTRRVFLSPEG